ncbi:protein kinase domain-containing protein [Kitasatospora sp. NPDC001574]
MGRREDPDLGRQPRQHPPGSPLRPRSRSRRRPIPPEHRHRPRLRLHRPRWPPGRLPGDGTDRRRVSLHRPPGRTSRPGQHPRHRLCVSDALAAAHDASLVHRDIKPANIMVPNEGATAAKVVNFGITKSADPEHHITAIGLLIGTPAYMAPETFTGELDHRSDLHAFGCVLHEALAGTPPGPPRHRRRTVRATPLWRVPPGLRPTGERTPAFRSVCTGDPALSGRGPRHPGAAWPRCCPGRPLPPVLTRPDDGSGRCGAAGSTGRLCGAVGGRLVDHAVRCCPAWGLRGVAVRWLG